MFAANSFKEHSIYALAAEAPITEMFNDKMSYSFKPFIAHLIMPVVN